MFDTGLPDATGAAESTDTDPIVELRRSAAAAGIPAATLEEVPRVAYDLAL